MKSNAGPGGETIALGLPDGSVRLWRVDDGTLVHTFPGGSKICSLAFSPDGRHIFAGTWSGLIERWTIDGGERLPGLTEHAGPVLSLDFAPGGEVLASASLEGGVILWRTADGAMLQQEELSAAATGVDFSPGGELLAVRLAQPGHPAGSVGLFNHQCGYRIFVAGR